MSRTRRTIRAVTKCLQMLCDQWNRRATPRTLWLSSSLSDEVPMRLIRSALPLALLVAACTDAPTPVGVDVHPRAPTGLSASARGAPQSVSIALNFNGTPISAGRTIWFNAVVTVPKGLPANGATMSVTNGSIQFTAGATNYTIPVPPNTITFSSSATEATTTFDGTSWQTTVPTSYSGNVFLGGVAYTVPTALPGGINPVTWSTEFTSSTAGLSVQWQWAAAVYTQFASDNNSIGVKPIDGDKLNAYANSDHGGTPENEKAFVTGGAGGGGGSNWTGGYSGTGSAQVFQQVASLYVANYLNNSITIYALGANGNVAPTATIAGSNTGLGQPDGLAFDASGRLYVSNAYPYSVTIYAPGASGNVAPVATIGGSNTGLITPDGIAFDASGQLYVTNPQGFGVSGGYITIYAAGASGNVAPTATIAGSNTGLSYPNNPSDVAFNSSGQLYVTNPSSSMVTIYAAGASGNVAPTATIAGSNTGLDYPWGLAFDASGQLYVANATYSPSGSVTIYAAGASGNVAPTATIAGSNTGLSFAIALALDASGRVYVANYDNSSVTIYAAGASGNVAPVATIAGSNTGLNGPQGLAIH